MPDVDFTLLKQDIDAKITTKTQTASITQIIVGTILKDAIDQIGAAINGMPDPATALAAAQTASFSVLQLTASLSQAVNKIDQANMSVDSLSGDLTDLQAAIEAIPDPTDRLAALQNALNAIKQPVSLPNTIRKIPLDNLSTSIIAPLVLTANIVLTPDSLKLTEGGTAIFPITPNGFLVDVSAFVDLGSSDITKIKSDKPAIFCFSRSAGVNNVLIRIAPADLNAGAATTTPAPAAVVVGSSPLTISAVTQTGLTLNYDTPSNALSVEVDQSLTPDFASHTTVTGKVITGLTAGTRYYYRFRGVNGSVFGDYTYADSTTLAASVTNDNSLASSGYTLIDYFDAASTTIRSSGHEFGADNFAFYADSGTWTTTNGVFTIPSGNNLLKTVLPAGYTSGKTYQFTFYNTNWFSNSYVPQSQYPASIAAVQDGTNAVFTFTVPDGTNTNNANFYAPPFDLTFSAIKIEIKN